MVEGNPNINCVHNSKYSFFKENDHILCTAWGAMYCTVRWCLAYRYDDHKLSNPNRIQTKLDVQHAKHRFITKSPS